MEAIGGDDASVRQDQLVLRVADPTRAHRGDDASVLEDEVAQKVAARASARQDSALEDEVAWGVVAARDSENTDVSARPVSPSRYQDGTDAVSWRVHFVRCVQASGNGKKEVDGLQGVQIQYSDNEGHSEEEEDEGEEEEDKSTDEE